MTELGWVTAFEQTEKSFDGSIGRLLPNIMLNIVGDDGTLITEQHRSGEAYIKSESMFSGYINSPIADANAFDNSGYYRTGDLVYKSQGKIFLIGRIKEIMKVNGWQVSPQELEDVVRQLDDIVDCAVIEHTVEDSNGLEQTCPRAFVVVTPHAQISGPAIQAYVAKHVVAYKRLTGGVVFTDIIPRNSTGKILRHRLAAAEIVTNERNNLFVVGTKEALVPGSKFGPKEIVQKILGRDVGELWIYYLKVVIFLPLCLVLGLPGVVLVAAALRR